VKQHGRLVPDQATLNRVRGDLQGFKIGSWQDKRTLLIPRSLFSGENGGRSEVLRDFVSFTDLEGQTNRFASDELVRKVKVGPFTVTLPWNEQFQGKPSMQDVANRFFAPHPVKIDEAAARYADDTVRSLSKVWCREKIQLLPLKEAIFRFSGKHSFGYPYFSSDADKYLFPCYEQSYKIASTLDVSLALAFPALMGTRAVGRGVDLPAKSRVIWMCARATNNIAKMLFEPLFDKLRNHPTFAMWNGKRFVDKIVPRMIKSTNGPILSGDFENFDASIPVEVIDKVFSIIGEWFDTDAQPLINLVRREFNGCGLIVPGDSESPDLDILMYRQGGIPSGHVLTNLVGSLVNIWVMAYAACKIGCTLRFCLVQGDDGVYTFDGAWSKAQLSAELAKDLGLTLHVDKSLESDSRIMFCSMIHDVGYANGAGVRLFMQIMNNALSRERVFSKDYTHEMDVLRFIQQWEDAEHHPCFESACHWLTLKLGQPRSVMDLIRASGGLLAAARAFRGGACQYSFDVLHRLRDSKTVAAMFRSFGA